MAADWPKRELSPLHTPAHRPQPRPQVSPCPATAPCKQAHRSHKPVPLPPHHHTLPQSHWMVLRFGKKQRLERSGRGRAELLRQYGASECSSAIPCYAAHDPRVPARPLQAAARCQHFGKPASHLQGAVPHEPEACRGAQDRLDEAAGCVNRSRQSC